MKHLRQLLAGYAAYFARGRSLSVLHCERCERETVHALRGKSWVCLETSKPGGSMCLTVHAPVDTRAPPG